MCLSLSNSKTLNIIIIYSLKLSVIKNPHTYANIEHTHATGGMSVEHDTKRLQQNSGSKTIKFKDSWICNMIVSVYVVATWNMKWNRPYYRYATTKKKK